MTQHHKLSKSKALGLMANIDRESSFQINPQGGDGGNSFGMFNGTTPMDPARMKKTLVIGRRWKGQIDYLVVTSCLNTTK